MKNISLVNFIGVLFLVVATAIGGFKGLLAAILLLILLAVLLGQLERQTHKSLLKDEEKGKPIEGIKEVGDGNIQTPQRGIGQPNNVSLKSQSRPSVNIVVTTELPQSPQAAASSPVTAAATVSAPSITLTTVPSRRLSSWVYEETISREIAEGLIKSSTWWLTHVSGSPVKAPGHAKRIYSSPRHGWVIEFGANSFLIGKAIKRAQRKLIAAENESKTGTAILEKNIRQEMEDAICGSVANVNGEEYAYYPPNNGDLVFGAQAIDLKQAVDYIIRVSGAHALFSTPRAA